MNPEPLETAELLAFARTVESQSLSRAATELRVPRATLSRRLARLEARLGVRLLKRTTRRLTLTDAGQTLYAHARTVLDAVARAEASVRGAEGGFRGDLKVSMPPLRDSPFHDFVVDFARAHPEVRLFVQSTTQYVDLTGSGYDVALRASTRLEPGLVAKQISKTELVAVASPTYLAEHGTPTSLADLRGQRCLMMFARGEVPETHWPLRDGKRHRVDGAFFSNDVVLLAHAARRGLGIAIVPRLLVADALESGELVSVMPRRLGAEARFSIVFAERELLPPQVRAFIDAVSRLPRTHFEPTPLPAPKRAAVRERPPKPRRRRSGP